VAAGSVIGDLMVGNIITAGKYIQVGDVNKNYKFDGTNGLIRTIGTNTYNIFSYVTSGQVLFDGTNTYKDINLTNYGLTDYIAILYQEHAQIWKYNWDTTVTRNLTLNWEKLTDHNYCRILFYSTLDNNWIAKGTPYIEIENPFTGDWSTWRLLTTTSAGTTGARIS